MINTAESAAAPVFDYANIHAGKYAAATRLAIMYATGIKIIHSAIGFIYSPIN